jgi:hypothetical protein
MTDPDEIRQEAMEMEEEMKLAACGFDLHDAATGNDHQLAARTWDEAVSEAAGLMLMRGIARGQVHAIDEDGGLVKSSEMSLIDLDTDEMNFPEPSKDEGWPGAKN